MKKITTLIAASVCMMMVSLSATAQNVSTTFNGDAVELTKDTVAQLTQFTVKNNNGKIYLHWIVVNQHVDGIYSVYRSEDGQNFELAGNKQGIGVPISKEISYYFTDECSCEGTLYYKLIHISENKNIVLSKTISVVNTVQTMSKVF